MPWLLKKEIKAPTYLPTYITPCLAEYLAVDENKVI